MTGDRIVTEVTRQWCECRCNLVWRDVETLALVTPRLQHTATAHQRSNTAYAAKCSEECTHLCITETEQSLTKQVAPLEVFEWFKSVKTALPFTTWKSRVTISTILRFMHPSSYAALMTFTRPCDLSTLTVTWCELTPEMKIYGTTCTHNSTVEWVAKYLQMVKHKFDCYFYQSRTKWVVSLLHFCQQDKILIKFRKSCMELYVPSPEISKWPLGTLQEQMVCSFQCLGLRWADITLCQQRVVLSSVFVC